MVKPLTGQVALVTGAGAIGAATAKALAADGAAVAILDIDGDRGARRRRSRCKGLGFECDVTKPERCRRLRQDRCERFGGVDIVVSNAGAAWQGRIGDVSDELLRQSFELNFFAHQTVAKEAVRIMLKQGTGGALLFNLSKQAVNPGANFGPYGLPKAAAMLLMRQYALDYGKDGIRSNGVNADRVRSGLLTDAMIAERAKARGLSEARIYGRQSARARGARRGRGAGLRGARQGAQDQRPYRGGGRRQHRRGAALSCAVMPAKAGIPVTAACMITAVLITGLPGQAEHMTRRCGLALRRGMTSPDWTLDMDSDLAWHLIGVLFSRGRRAARAASAPKGTMQR